EFVSQLMGDPEINIVPCVLKKTDGIYSIELEGTKKTYRLPNEENLYNKLEDAQLEKVDVGFRPQHVSYSFEKVDGYVEAKVYSYESIGNKSVIIVSLNQLYIRIIAPNGLVVKLDQDIYIDFDVEFAIFFNAETTEYICRYDEASIMERSAAQAKAMEG
ncbi:MAG: ABC transporter ATP-binding protein, partial [Lachnospiraceae bacterium]